MPLRPDELDLVARLAHLRLDDSEIAELAPQLARILDYMAQLDEVDVSDVQGTSHVAAAPCPLREDRETPSISGDAATGGAPEVRDGMFAVPRIIG